MNFYIEFIPSGQDVCRLPIQAVDKFEAERIAFELATIFHAHKIAIDSAGLSKYSCYTTHSKGYNSYCDVHFEFHVVGA